MKVLLLKDVYNLGRAGDVKKVASGYGRNYLIPQKMAMLASSGSLKQVGKIKEAAVKKRKVLNEEMAGLAEQLTGLELLFKAKVGETGKLYGSVTQQMIIEAISKKIGAFVDRRWIESQPLREVGEYTIKVRLTFDLVPEIKVVVESEEEEEEEKKNKRKARVKENAQEVESNAEKVDVKKEIKEEKKAETEPASDQKKEE